MSMNMEKIYHEDSFFEKHIFTAAELKQVVFENCRFVNCSFENMQILSSNFSDCTFLNCNFSMTKLPDTQLANVSFENCKLMGLNFKDCSTFIFEVGFKKCILDYASFEGRKMKKTKFEHCSLKGVDFTGADISESSFLRCDLTDAIFHATNLKGADLSSSYSYIIHPDENYIKNARFSLDGLPGLLVKHNIIIS